MSVFHKRVILLYPASHKDLFAWFIMSHDLFAYFYYEEKPGLYLSSLLKKSTKCV